jgi:hypothetical protein
VPEPAERREPLLTIDVPTPWYAGKAIPIFVIFSVAIGVEIGRAMFPWSPSLRLEAPVGAAAVALLLGLALRLSRRHFIARTGRAIFFEDRVVLAKSRIGLRRPITVELEWRELAGFRDGSIDYVELIPRRPDVRAMLTVPTPSEEERTAVLALLDAHGV